DFEQQTASGNRSGMSARGIEEGDSSASSRQCAPRGGAAAAAVDGREERQAPPGQRSRPRLTVKTARLSRILDVERAARDRARSRTRLSEELEALKTGHSSANARGNRELRTAGAGSAGQTDSEKAGNNSETEATGWQPKQSPGLAKARTPEARLIKSRKKPSSGLDVQRRELEAQSRRSARSRCSHRLTEARRVEAASAAGAEAHLQAQAVELKTQQRARTPKVDKMGARAGRKMAGEFDGPAARKETLRKELDELRAAQIKKFDERYAVTAGPLGSSLQRIKTRLTRTRVPHPAAAGGVRRLAERLETRALAHGLERSKLALEAKLDEMQVQLEELEEELTISEDARLRFGAAKDGHLKSCAHREDQADETRRQMAKTVKAISQLDGLKTNARPAATRKREAAAPWTARRQQLLDDLNSVGAAASGTAETSRIALAEETPPDGDAPSSIGGDAEESAQEREEARDPVLRRSRSWSSRFNPILLKRARYRSETRSPRAALDRQVKDLAAKLTNWSRTASGAPSAGAAALEARVATLEEQLDTGGQRATVDDERRRPNSSRPTATDAGREEKSKREQQDLEEELAQTKAHRRRLQRELEDLGRGKEALDRELAVLRKQEPAVSPAPQEIFRERNVSWYQDFFGCQLQSHF
uniref:Paramyosin n=1 Tax=Macrostomum lignano TaxID=282301 RepID=A0A1I8FCT1_9PLAT